MCTCMLCWLFPVSHFYCHVSCPAVLVPNQSCHGQAVILLLLVQSFNFLDLLVIVDHELINMLSWIEAMAECLKLGGCYLLKMIGKS
ncbi:hypothetical protein ASPBRDRAFT_386775 [Aspergillus brasiliensis CBS 101740]|uniref:Uncharacterized protein n=1 Tax=Aspergillus brasiliensis (strain CBS 101740 / IMI 381727 / IBT 21946) TaxID=767769 RepID=A0A1L9UW39_ASPBC|nr:hypothetical protein ASPBRDRAFT_386775 [Aspergillus brasiliensis CBS 101740]